MAECSNAASQQASEVNVLNSKLGYDVNAALQNQMLANNQTLNNQSLADNQASARAWEAFKLKQAHDSHIISQLAGLDVITSSQTGQTENQQSVTPIRTGLGDALAANALPANRAIDASTALGQGAITANVANVLAAWLAAQVATAPVILNASGGASTPSQTQPKPAA